MQIYSVRNSGSGVGFNSHKNFEDAVKLVKMDDSQLKFLAYAKSYDEDSEKKHRKSALRMFYAIPIVDSLASGVLLEKLEKQVKTSKKAKKAMTELVNPNLSERVGIAAKRGALWAGAIAIVGTYCKIKNKIISKSPSLQDFEQRHPLLSLMRDFGLLGSIYIAGKMGLGSDKVKNIREKSEIVKSFNKLGKTVGNVIDESTFNKKIVPEISKCSKTISKKAPWAAIAGKFALANSVLILFGAAIVKMIAHERKESKKVENAYYDLKDKQFETAQCLKNALEDNVGLSKSERKEINKSLRVYVQQNSEEEI